MKTKEQVQEHLMNNAYPKDVINKIMGYIVAKGIKESDENVFYKTKTNGAWYTFDEFVEWFEEKEHRILSFKPVEDINEFLDYILVHNAKLKGYDKKEFIPFYSSEIFKDWNYYSLDDSLTYKGKCCYYHGEWAKFKEKEDEIDLIENEFYHITMSDDSETIIQYKSCNDKIIMSRYLFSISRDEYQLGIIGTYSIEHIKSYRPATAKEKQQLISAVEKEYNKTWNSKEWIDYVEYLDEKYETYLDNNGSIGLSILINDGRQALLFDSDSQEYGILPFKIWRNYVNKVRCKLVEVKSNDLKAGDFFYSKTFDGIYLYDGEKVIKSLNLGISELWDAKVYKLVPIL